MDTTAQIRKEILADNGMSLNARNVKIATLDGRVTLQGPVNSQEDLQRALRKRGFKVGQATLSRDIRDLNLSKTAAGYTLPHGDGASGLEFIHIDRLMERVLDSVRSRKP